MGDQRAALAKAYVQHMPAFDKGVRRDEGMEAQSAAHLGEEFLSERLAKLALNLNVLEEQVPQPAVMAHERANIAHQAFIDRVKVRRRAGIHGASLASTIAGATGED